MKKITVVLMFVSLFIFGQESALTRSGDEVILNPDGTWTYAKVDGEDSVSTFEFRKAKWGSSQETVRGLESADIIEEVCDNKILGYSGSVGGLDCLIAYIFVDDQLWKGSYIFSEEHSNRNKFIDDYSSIKTNLVEKYGEPTDENSYWSNDLYADDQSHYGFAVSMGHLSFYATWEVGETQIGTSLTGDNYKINHKVEYYNERLRKIAAQRQKKASSSDF